MHPNIRLGLLFVLLVAAAAIAAWRFGGPEASDIPDTDDTATTWMCATTGQVFRFTARQLGERMSDPTRFKHLGGRGGPLVLWNDETQDFTIMRARYSKEHEVYYIPQAEGHALQLPEPE